MNIFPQLTSGDSATWLDTAFVDSQGTNYDSSQYALRYEIRGPVSLTLNATTLGTGWTTTITTAQSATLTPGKYYWTAIASKTGVRVTAGSGTTSILADLSAASGVYDGSSQAEKDLIAIRAEISARASGGMTLEYAIGNRSLKKEPIASLLVLEARLVRQVAAERSAQSIANGLGNPRRLNVRFVGTS